MPRRRKHSAIEGPAYPSPGLIRAARRRTDLSQRDLARGAQVHPSTVGRIEAGTLEPSLEVFRRLLGATGHYLTVVDDDGRVLHPMLDRDDLRDGAERRYPAHLDVIPDPVGTEWWGSIYGLARPPETFYRSRSRRDAQRRRSQWEVRVKQHRHLPEPPEVPGYSYGLAPLPPARYRPPAVEEIPDSDYDVDEWCEDYCDDGK